MEPYKLGEMEEKFADLIWYNAPVRSGELVKLCEEAFGWKKSTTYTMLGRLCSRGLFENRRGTVEVLMSREEFKALQGEQFINETFHGSLPQFLATFIRRGKLSDEEIGEIETMIREHREG